MPHRVKEACNDEGLTTQELAFVEAICAGMTPAQAYKSAGYTSRLSAVQSNHPIHRPVVKDAIAARQNKMRDDAQISRGDVLRGLQRAIKDASLQADSMAQIAGWREIGKMLGYYEPEKREIVLSDRREEAIRQLQEVSMDDLLELAGDSVIDGEFELVVEPTRAITHSH
jgi:hypothetical protein